MKRKNLVLLSLLFTLFLSSVTFAQPGFRRQRVKRIHRKPVVAREMLGIRVGSDFDHEQKLIGAQLVLPAGTFWRLVPSFDYYFVGNEEKYDRWQFNGDLIFKPRPFGVVYFGGGLAVDYRIPEQGLSSTNFGGNAIVGLEFQKRLSPIGLYVQARWTFLNETYFSVLGGLNLALR